LSLDVKQMVQMVLEGQDKKKTIDEICHQYGISRNNYYKLRQEIISMALEFFCRRLENNGDECYYVLKEHRQLQKKAQRLAQEKAKWELKYKWLTWQLEDDGKKSEYTKNRIIKDAVPGGLKSAEQERM